MTAPTLPPLPDQNWLGVTESVFLYAERRARLAVSQALAARDAELANAHCVAQACELRLAALEAQIASAEEVMAEKDAEIEHWYKLALSHVEAPNDKPVWWKERAERAEAELVALRAQDLWRCGRRIRELEEEVAATEREIGLAQQEAYEYRDKLEEAERKLREAWIPTDARSAHEPGPAPSPGASHGAGDDAA